jgi:hypothetical protein
MTIFLTKDLSTVVTATSPSISKQLLECEELFYVGYISSSSPAFTLESKHSVPQAKITGSDYLRNRINPEDLLFSNADTQLNDAVLKK